MAESDVKWVWSQLEAKGRAGGMGLARALSPGAGWELGACPRGAEMAIAKIWQKERV